MALIRKADGTPLMCCWADCTRSSDSRHEARVRGGAQDGGTLIYTFCTERHKKYYITSHAEFGVLPAGDKRSLL